MWILLFISCLIPLIPGLFFPRIRLWIVYLVLAVGLLLVMIPIHHSINAKHDPDGAYNEGNYKVYISRNKIEQVTGSFGWRFFEWGIIEGSDGLTTFRSSLHDNFGVNFNEAKKYDITNPTPFHLFLWLLLLSFFGDAIVGRARGKSNSAAAEESTKSNGESGNPDQFPNTCPQPTTEETHLNPRSD